MRGMHSRSAHDCEGIHPPIAWTIEQGFLPLLEALRNLSETEKDAAL